MAKRLYVTDIIGDGSRMNPYRSVIASIANPHNRVTVIDVARFPNSCGILVAAPNHVPYNPHAAITPFPDSGYSSLWALLDPAGIGLTTPPALATRGFAITVFSGLSTFGDVINGIFRQIEPAFTVLNFDVLEYGTGPAPGAPEPEEIDLGNGKKVWVLR